MLKLVLTVCSLADEMIQQMCQFARGTPRPYQERVKQLKYRLSLIPVSSTSANGISFKIHHQERKPFIMFCVFFCSQY